MTIEPQELAETVSSWLIYKSHTGFRKLLTESTLTLPIGEYLSTRYKNDLRSEEVHPLFKNQKQGRPRQIDYVRLKHGSPNWHAAYECKFLPTSRTSIVDDICRLICLSQAENIGKPERYLILAGQHSEQYGLLNFNMNAGDGPRVNAFLGILSQNIDPEIDAVQRVRLDGLIPKQREMFSRFCTTYDARIPAIIETRLVGWSVVSLFGCAVWRVAAVKGAKLIGSEDLKQ